MSAPLCWYELHRELVAAGASMRRIQRGETTGLPLVNTAGCDGVIESLRKAELRFDRALAACSGGTCAELAATVERRPGHSPGAPPATHRLPYGTDDAGAVVGCVCPDCQTLRGAHMARAR